MCYWCQGFVFGGRFSILAAMAVCRRNGFAWFDRKPVLAGGSRGDAWVPTTSPTIRGLKRRLSDFCTLVLGVVLALGLAQGWPLPLNELTNLHASFGLAAWATVLLVALSYVVVPMFQLTPPYPAR